MPRLNRFYLGFFIDGRLAGVVVLGWGTQPLQTIRKLFPCHVLRTTDYIEIGKMCFLPDFNDTQCFGSIVISQMVKWLKANTRLPVSLHIGGRYHGKMRLCVSGQQLPVCGELHNKRLPGQPDRGRKSTRGAPGSCWKKTRPLTAWQNATG